MEEIALVVTDEEIKKHVAKREASKLGKVSKFFKSEDKGFIQACEKVGLTPTKRQASKWLMKKGKAFKEGR